MLGIESMEHVPAHLRSGVEAMRAHLLEAGAYRHKKRGKDLPEWKVSICGARCALLLTKWIGGLHHLPRNHQTYDIDWSRHFVEVLDPLYSGLSTFDGDGLTELVLLAAEHCIRVDISPRMHHIVVELHPRSVLGDCISERHVSLGDLSSRIKCRMKRAEDGEP